MRKNKIDRFVDGELNIDAFQEKESGFTDAYQKVIAEANSQSHEFNPFKKVEITRKYRMRLAKRVLAYAASFLIVISVFWILQKSRLEKTQVVLSDQELLEIKNNTEMALKQFSKELNNCLTTFNDAKKLSEPISSIQSLKNIEINKNNPLKNIKLNEL